MQERRNSIANALELHLSCTNPLICFHMMQHSGPQLTLNTLRPWQNGRHFADDVFKCIFLNENMWILLKISLKFVPKSPTNNIPSLVRIMAWRRPGDKPLSEPMMDSLLTHICVTRPQWVNMLNCFKDYKRCIHISYHILDCIKQKKTKFTLEQLYMGSILYCRYHTCWCPGDFRSQGISRHGIDQMRWNIPSLASEKLTFKIHILFLLERWIFLWLKINI